jgi:hypothetical protein
MPMQRSWLLSSVLAAVITAPAAQAQTCKADVPWEHEHASGKAHVVTTDIKGSGSTRIEVCRGKESSADELPVAVQFAGSHGARELKPGQCTDKLAKWAIIRTQAAKAAGGPAKVGGVYRICKD